MRNSTLDGKRVAWHETTPFLVQVGKGRSAYKTRYSITGNLGQAVLLYKAINIGNGFKKRLWAPTMNKPLLARSFS